MIESIRPNGKMLSSPLGVPMRAVFPVVGTFSPTPQIRRVAASLRQQQPVSLQEWLDKMETSRDLP